MICRWRSLRCEHYRDGRCTRSEAETWQDRVEELLAGDLPAGYIRLRIPEDLYALARDWDRLRRR